MAIWILTVWLVLPNGLLETVSQAVYESEAHCLAAAAEIEMPDGVSWISSCRAGIKDSKP